MQIQLVQGEFSVNDAFTLIRQLILEKIKYHENKISLAENEEDNKSREAKIKRLQKELFEVRNIIKTKQEAISIDFELDIK